MSRIDSRSWTGLEPTWWEEQGVGATRADDWADRWCDWREDKIQRLKALAMLWGPAVPARPIGSWRRGWSIYDGHVTARGEEWTFGRALRATIGILLFRVWGEIDAEGDRQRCARIREQTGRRVFHDLGLDLGHWDYRDEYGGWSCMMLQLYRGCRVEIFSDGDSSL
jgi:hypothetical protein